MSKKQKYELVIKQIEAVTADERDLIANLSNIVAIIHNEFNFLWTGFYFVKENELVLGPFQGPLACTRIPFGKGVCGTSWEKKETIVVANVHEFPGHIACSSLSESEIVVPIRKEGEVVALLDVDSESLNTFDDIDRECLEKISSYITQLF